MGRGSALAAFALLALSLATVSPGADAARDRLLMDEDRLEQGRGSMIHVVVDPPADPVDSTLDVQVIVEGPGSGEEIEVTRDLQGRGQQLVSVPWTPQQGGNHTLHAKATIGDEVRIVEEQRTVFVSAATTNGESSGGLLPETAPGTVQWAIAFGVLFFVARAGLDRRPQDR